MGKRLDDKVVEFAKAIPFGYFVVGGTFFAVTFAFALFALQNYLFFGEMLSWPYVVMGFITPLLTASICFYFAAIIIQKLIYTENSLVLHNVALQEQIEKEIEKSRQKGLMLMQQSKLALMGEMMGAVAHQWRQPLNALGLMIQDIKDAKIHGELTDEYIAKVVEDSMSRIQFMSKTIDDFRNFFAPASEISNFYIEDSVDVTLQIAFSQLADGGISVMFNKFSRHLFTGHKGEFQQVILNIIANAKDALMQTNPKQKMINIDINSDEKNIYVVIEDTGGGIDPKLLHRIFEPYFTTKEQGKGVGIGLYMSKQLVERHMGGTITVANGERGARFTVTLPIMENV